jgi:hypothetical protein
MEITVFFKQRMKKVSFPKIILGKCSESQEVCKITTNQMGYKKGEPTEKNE